MDYIYSATKKPCPAYIFQNILICHVVKIKSVTPIFLPMDTNVQQYSPFRIFRCTHSKYQSNALIWVILYLNIQVIQNHPVSWFALQNG